MPGAQVPRKPSASDCTAMLMTSRFHSHAVPAPFLTVVLSPCTLLSATAAAPSLHLHYKSDVECFVTARVLCVN
jgi:hypothetical protein